MEDRVYQEGSPDQYLAEDYILSTEKRPVGTESRSATKSRHEPSTLRKKKVTVGAQYKGNIAEQQMDMGEDEYSYGEEDESPERQQNNMGGMGGMDDMN